MMIRNITLLAILVFSLSSCEDYIEFLRNNNNPPSIQVLDADGNFKSDITTGIKLPSDIKQNRISYLPLRLRVFDAENSLASITAKVVAGSGYFQQNEEKITTESIKYSGDGIAEIQYHPDKTALSVHKIELTVTDNLGNVGKATVSVNVFINYPPQAAFKLTQLDVNAPYEFDFDATESKDADAAQGGQIVALEWNINGSKFTDPLVDENGEFDGILKTRFVFPGKGTYEIRLVAIDNDGARSTEVSVVRTIN